MRERAKKQAEPATNEKKYWKRNQQLLPEWMGQNGIHDLKTKKNREAEREREEAVNAIQLKENGKWLLVSQLNALVNAAHSLAPPTHSHIYLWTYLFFLSSSK